MKIDCSKGEGGGQTIRTALALSCITGKEVKLENIRAKRPNPGLQRQHLTCVNALKEMSGAEVKGAELHSTCLDFKPDKLKGGNCFFDIGSAGSITLLIQCVLPVAAFSPEKSFFTFVGGTDVAWSPPHFYTEKILLPTLKKMGLNAEMKTGRWGFYPKGGGRTTLEVEPLKALKPIELTERGGLKGIRGVSVCSNLPLGVAERQKAAAEKEAASAGLEAGLRVESVDSLDKGSLVFLEAEYGGALAGFSALGEKGKLAEEVGKEAAKKLVEFHACGAAADEHLADQLIVWMALAEGKSTVSPQNVSGHAETNLQLVNEIADVKFECGGGKLEVWGKAFLSAQN